MDVPFERISKVKSLKTLLHTLAANWLELLSTGNAEESKLSV